MGRPRPAKAMVVRGGRDACAARAVYIRAAMDCSSSPTALA